ncbi:4Fe-4S binding protein [Thiohalobacter sp. IOR34]|uniref:4Fe-4S binding protein n=1 Tax=Thiohalobacter sp. IOR34 TaxID=3057176 RepID=UPI0025AF4741|nr:4Fe-4S binding protein [Thiohalobacter sp. IOR34]WJW76845.1 4Fe-4S binding protein [Thiohalobacter sp. IOR34]
MTHPGLPQLWGGLILGLMLLISLWALRVPAPQRSVSRSLSLARVPLLGPLVRRMVTSPWPLLLLKLLMVGFFLLVIIAGLFGTPIPERNIATMLTWNLWWAGLVFSIFFLGSAWCAVCPWDALAQWLVRRRLWRRAAADTSLNLRVPRRLQNVWPALLLFIGLTWLELGVGITTSPYATALVALLMVVLATISLAIYQRKAFCRYFCPVGRTVGFYSQLSAVELRPIDADICVDCKTLECYHGNETIDPCPTWLVMGRLKQNSYCTSCGNCSQSCPQTNVAWRLRTPSVEAVHGARPRWDEAWFMLGLLALTAFHGITMMPFWEGWMQQLATRIGDSGQLLWSFSIGLTVCLLLVGGLYAALVAAARRLSGSQLEYRRAFASFAFVALPLAFAYHMAHNLNHLMREGAGLGAVFANPLGIDTAPLTMMEKHMRHMHMLISQEALFVLQAGLMVFGFVVAVQIVRYRGRALLEEGGHRSGWRLAPMLLFALLVNSAHLWLLMQPMVMRM